MTTREKYELLFNPSQNSDENKLKILTELIGGECKQSEKIEYLSYRAKLFSGRFQWEDVLNDISAIETMNGNKLNRSLRGLKIHAEIQMDLRKVREKIGNALASGGNPFVSYILRY
ncbi:unnamed protein product [Adineta ricciae]|uniref:Uncharacterized protein n=1 Tax=Adineta ricciae TaxID=249248 RepID=A0A815MSE2_ADIRI|nr:unnamed protein product [Adineta ricciae]